MHPRPTSVGFSVSYKVEPFIILKALHPTGQPARLREAGHIPREKHRREHCHRQVCWGYQANRVEASISRILMQIKTVKILQLLHTSWLS